MKRIFPIASITNIVKQYQKISLYILIIFFIIIKLKYFILVDYALLWDEIIYMSLGKYYFSFGEQGFFDPARPPLLSVLIGFIWFIGLDYLFWSKIIITLCSLGCLYYIYKISEHIHNKSGFWSVVVFCTFYLFSMLSNHIFTEIIGILFILMSTWYFLKNKLFISGILLSLGFLTRFVYGIFVIGFLLYLLYSWYLTIQHTKNKNRSISNKHIIYNTYMNALQKVATLFGGFSIFTSIYLLANYYFFNDFLYILSTGSKTILDSAFLYDHGPLYYLIVLLYQSGALLYVILCITICITQYRKINTKKNNLFLLFFLFIIPLLYFSLLLTHKEQRYIFPLLWLCAIMGGISISILLNYIAHKKKYIYTTVIIIAILVYSYLIYMNFSYQPYIISDTESEFFNFFDNMQNISLLTNDAYFILHKNIEVHTLPFWTFWKETLLQTTPPITHIAIHYQTLFCVDSHTCQEYDDFIAYSKNQKIVFNETFYKHGELQHVVIYEIISLP